MPNDRSAPRSRPLYRTPRGTAYVGDSLDGMRKHLDDESVQLFMTSPPFALSRKKEYGNRPSDEYIAWFRDFAEVMWDKLRPDGSLVIDLGGAWNKGSPTRSLYQFKLLLDLCENLGDRNFFLAQDFYWHNPSKMPLPAQWVNVERIRVKDSVNVIWWLSKTERPKADNRKVLRPYSRDMERLLEKQDYNGGKRPGGANVNPETWKRRHNGAIPPSAFEVPHDRLVADEELDLLRDNFLRHGGSESASRYHRACNALARHYAEDPGISGLVRKHPARFPLQIPSFFISMLTDEGDLVADPFAGSNVTGQAAEDSKRTWAAFEMHRHYLEPSVARFDSFFNGKFAWLGSGQPLLKKVPAEEYT